MRLRLRRVFALTLVASLCGCAAGSLFKATGMKKAVFDLQCPEEQIEVTRLDSAGREVGVRGCGKQTSYKVIDNSWTRQGEVVDAK